MIELKIEGMTCGGCARSVTRAIQTVDSSAKIDVDLKAGKATVESTASLDAVMTAVREAGYPVTANTPA